MSQPPYGQPYPEQPNPGQPPYGPPYQGQPNPDVPNSAPPQPGYGQPGYGQPSYGQPDYSQQPGYGQQQPGYAPPPGYNPQPTYGAEPGFAPQPGYGQPGFPPPPPPKKSRALPITLVSIGVVLVLCVGGSIAVYLGVKNKAEDVVSALATPTAGADPTGGTSTPTENAADISIIEPKTLGGRAKLTDKQFAGLADLLKGSLSGVPDAGNTVGALYGEAAKQDIVAVVAAEAPIDDPASELSDTFLSSGTSGVSLTDIVSVSTGSLGGTAKCGNATASGVKMTMCAWADKGSIGSIIWYFKTVSQVKAEFPKLRAEIEKSS